MNEVFLSNIVTLPKTYIPYHLHTELSLLDSCTNYKDYINLCVKHDIPAIAFSEHGNIMNWFEKKQYCDKKGIKFIFACEVYLTETLDKKNRDNYHTILIAKNNQGVSELMDLVSTSSQPDHFYYDTRITFDEFLSTSKNIISTSACLGSPLNKLDKNSPYYEKLANKYTFYEIQMPDYQKQHDYNMYLYNLAKKYNKPLILGTDTHSSTQYKAECRKILKTAKKMIYSDEDLFDLTFQTVESLLNKYNSFNGKYNLIPYQDYLTAVNNTNVLNEMVEDISIDTSFKYPNLYQNEEKYFKSQIIKMYREKVDKGIIDGNNLQYKKNINEEFKVFKKLGMCSFMLFMSELSVWCHKNDIPTGFCRGSVGGSTVAYILDIIDVNPIKWNTIFSRFVNEDRVSLGDIDLDFAPQDRERVCKYIIDTFGEKYTCYILTTGTMADKRTIDEIARALTIDKNTSMDIKNKYSISNTKIIKQKFDDIQQEYTKVYNEVLNKKKKVLDFFKHEEYLEDIKKANSDTEIQKFINSYSLYEHMRKEYEELFYYFDGLKSTVISKGVHPAGMVASPIALKNNIGLMYNEGRWVSQINMNELHDLNYVKYDILGLKNIGIIKDTYKFINSPYLKSHEINWEDQDVWKGIIKSPVGLFQFEGNFSYDLLKKYINRKIQNKEKLKINDLSLINASLRPSGESYRNRLVEGEKNINPSKEINDLLKDNNGFLVFQEDSLKFLIQICGFNGSHADNIRRAIGQKRKDVLEKELPKILDGYCKYSSKPKEVAEEEAKQFLQILEDSSDYQFGYNHSTGYSMIGYNCALLRHYYPLEFTTAYLNNADNENDINMGTELMQQLNININQPKFRYSKAEYMMDKETNSIYKGISSIKFLNKQVADDLYELKNNQYGTFYELLKDIKEKTSCNSRQLDILVRCDFFKEFGAVNKLLKFIEYFDILYSKKAPKKKTIKEKISDENIINLIEKNSTPTDATYTKFDYDKCLNEIISVVPDTPTTLKESLDNQREILGMVTHTDKSFSNRVFYVSELEVLKFITNIKLYRVKDGKSQNVKMWTSQYNKNQFDLGDFLYLNKIDKKMQKKPTGEINQETGKKIYKDVEGVYECWLSSYKNITWEFEVENC